MGLVSHLIRLKCCSRRDCLTQLLRYFCLKNISRRVWYHVGSYETYLGSYPYSKNVGRAS